MPVNIKHIAAGSIAEALGWQVGDQILAINGQTIADVIDLRFHASDEVLDLKVRTSGQVTDLQIEKDPDEPLGIDVEEFRIKTCGDDCIFCFVDQNPAGLREALYFRDGDYRMSFLYGNYITMTNLRERDLQRIVTQRLTPLYVSVHCTNEAIRRRMMGHRTQNDRLMEKLHFLRDHGIDMHTQIVLVPTFNDGDALAQTIADLYALRPQLQSISIVPVGLTQHRQSLADLRPLTPAEARDLIETVSAWQAHYRADIGTGFVYVSDEMYLLADVDFPDETAYDDFPLIENGVGMSRDFLNELAFQQAEFPAALPAPRHLTIATGELAAPILENHVAPALRTIENLTVDVIVAKNTLFGPPVTVSGLLGYQCYANALKGKNLGDLLLLPPDSVNFEGCFLDNRPGTNTPAELGTALNVPVEVFSGDWMDMLALLA